jgi:hypothetical protein
MRPKLGLTQDAVRQKIICSFKLTFRIWHVGSWLGFCAAKKTRNQGCQIFLDTISEKLEKIYQITTQLATEHNLYVPNGLNVIFYVRLSKIYQNLGFLV